eukprot:TRINITY_DN19543_c0_g1_i1.p1 TRINITY_DN19543_c0_g1~~TRINITY_DN19543_c0_g1_i1.p1  ORF type:complete len:251 (+),score=68.06 TRINITY_DN19543_c0_g1_i1:112-864(+)
MKAFVGCKRVIDYAVKPRINPEKTGVVTQNVKMSINPFDEIAVEEALKLKEKGIVKEIVAVMVGPSAGSLQLTNGPLAMGADRGILVEIPEEDANPLLVAKVFQKLIAKENPELVLLGKQAIDNDANQTGQILAGLMQWPQGTCASKVEMAEKQVTVTREIDSGLRTVTMDLPAIVTCDLRLNTPRFATLQNIMKARKKTIEKTTPKDLGVDFAPKLKVLQLDEPSVRKAGIKVATVEDLVGHLKKTGTI